MPKSAPSKAAVRNLLQRLDTTLHLHIATISVGIAFATSSSRSIRTIKHSSRTTRQCPIPAFRPCTAMSCHPALARNRSCLRSMGERQLADMNTALASGDWLVGDELTLADLAYLPYMSRFGTCT